MPLAAIPLEPGSRGANDHLSQSSSGPIIAGMSLRTRLAVKRIFDVIGASMVLMALSPLFGTVALLVRWRLGSPVFFRQLRPGLGGVPVTIVKFRTMHNAFDPDGQDLPDGERLTRFGQCLRKTSLDELPELWNVIRGDLSLVGPRPLLMKYLPIYSQEQARRHEVRPGITGWAQVNGRNALSWERKFELDIWYVDNWSLRLDLKIMGLTLIRVLQRSGITEKGHPTMREFTWPEVTSSSEGLHKDHSAG